MGLEATDVERRGDWDFLKGPLVQQMIQSLSGGGSGISGSNYKPMNTNFLSEGSDADEPSPLHRRWWFARDTLRTWMAVFAKIGMKPPIYLLNAISPGGNIYQSTSDISNFDPDRHIDSLFRQRPNGTTPMTQAIQRALDDFKSARDLARAQAVNNTQNTASQGSNTKNIKTALPNQTGLILVLTDGEANDMSSFNGLLDEVQNGYHGDVQVLLVALSLIPSDVDWFENEECEDSRVRTVEAFQVERTQMIRREVIGTEGEYGYKAHVLRCLVTNLFPADYDYEAPRQTLLHRLYITLHGRDRWWRTRFPFTYGPLSIVLNMFYTFVFIVTGGCCCGLGQGNTDAGKCRLPDCLEAVSCAE